MFILCLVGKARLEGRPTSSGEEEDADMRRSHLINHVEYFHYYYSMPTLSLLFITTLSLVKSASRRLCVLLFYLN